MTYQIHCLNPIARVGLDLLPERFSLSDQLEGAHGALVRSAELHGLELPDTLEAIARAGAGVNNIPLEDCARKGIVVFNTPGANANGVKELVLAGMLLAARDLLGGAAWVHEHSDDPDIAKTTEKAKKAFAGTELKGKRLGVVGLGAIGARVANAAIHLGMDVLGYDPFLSVSAAWQLSRHVVHCRTLDELLETCDYITLHVPALDSTKGMLDRETMERLKPGVVILNFARDVLVEDDAMAWALDQGLVRKYVTDFPNPRVAAMPNTLVLPHLGASTGEAEDNCAIMAVRQLADYLENGNIVNSVNYPACDLGPRRGVRLAIFNQNVPNMIGQFASTLAQAGINIASMANQSRGNLAYTLLDVEGVLSEEVLQTLMGIQGVFKFRVIR